MYLLTTVKSLKADIFDISPWSVVTLETSAFKLLYGGQFTLSTQWIILNYPDDYSF